jgi:hypothetical protein
LIDATSVNAGRLRSPLVEFESQWSGSGNADALLCTPLCLDLAAGFR